MKMKSSLQDESLQSAIYLNIKYIEELKQLVIAD